jgi:hypothetical protein
VHDNLGWRAAGEDHGAVGCVLLVDRGR